MGELIVIAIVALLFLGPEKLPEAAKTLSKGIRDFRKQTRELQQTLEDDHEIGSAIRDIKSALRGEELQSERIRERQRRAAEAARRAAAAKAGDTDEPKAEDRSEDGDKPKAGAAADDAEAADTPSGADAMAATLGSDGDGGSGETAADSGDEVGEFALPILRVPSGTVASSVKLPPTPSTDHPPATTAETAADADEAVERTEPGGERSDEAHG